MTHTDMYLRAQQIADAALAAAGRIDADRAIPADLVAALKDSNLLRACAPSEVGGPELDPGAALRCAEAVARGDMSTGWCVSIAITSSLLAAYVSAETRAELFGDPNASGAGVWAPNGKATRVPGGVEVTGRWAFCSGIALADVAFFGCILDGMPHVVAVPTESLTIVDTWHTLGLHGTGSNDAVVEGLFVPDDRVFSILSGPLIDRPLYRFPIFGFFAACITAAALGNARAAIDDFVTLAATKKSGGAAKPLAARQTVHAAVAEAEAQLEAARALYYNAVESVWQASQLDEPVSVDERAALRRAATHGVRVAADVVRTVYDLAGTSAIYDGSSLQRRFRDAFTATAHFQVNLASFETPGRIQLDQPTESAML